MCPFCDKKIDKNTSTCKNKKGDILNTELSRTLTIAEAKEQYDENCKNILSNKVILAWILRRTVKEFAVYSIDRIMECIEKPTVSKVCVNPGLTNHQKITGINTEDAVNEEGVIYYDLRFFAIVPKTQEKIATQPPTQRETLAPYITRINKSLPNSSVPKI